MAMSAIPTADPQVTTIGQLLALPEDDLRHELLQGVHVVTPAPSGRHQHALALLFRYLDSALALSEEYVVLWSPADLVLASETLVQPDLFVIRKAADEPVEWDRTGVPLLVVEVLSHSTAPRDRGSKRKTYQQAGVRDYWIVDLDARLIERWRAADERPEVLHEAIEWTPEPDRPTAQLDLRSFFRDVVGKE